MDRIGKIYGISQSSVSRKIQRAIQNVITAAKRQVRLQVGLSSTDLESIFRMIQSCIDLTLTPFAEPPPTDLPAVLLKLESEVSGELARVDEPS